MKQEAPYIIEWVTYHKALGFEVIIADNGGDDDTSKILTALHNAKIITRIDFRFKKTSPQIPAYRAILRYVKQRGIDFIGFLDCDEFFTKEIPIKELSPSVGADYIASEFSRLNATQLSYQWLLYGSKTNFSDQSLPVLERFSHHSKIDEKRNVMDKSFVKVSEMFKFTNGIIFGPKILTPHHFHGANKRWYLDGEQIKKFDFHKQKTSYHSGAILHFQIKTWEEFQLKKNRGGGDTKWSRYHSNFFKNNDFNDINTKISQDIIKRLKSEIILIKKIIGDYAGVNPASDLLNRIRFRLMSIGLWDIENHLLIFLIYKMVKKFKMNHKKL